MFETALLSSPAPRRSLALPFSIAAHAAALAALLGASFWREEEIPEPPAPVTLVTLRQAPPPPPGSTTGTGVGRTGAAVSGRVAAPEVSDSLPSARPLPVFDLPAVSADGPGVSYGRDDGVPGGTGVVPGAAVAGEGAEDPFPIGGSVGAPELLRRVEPDYPEAARKPGIQGVVILQAIIDTTGRVEEVRVIESVFPPLDEAAARALRQWRYRPATLNGRAVRVYLTVTVDFRLR